MIATIGVGTGKNWPLSARKLANGYLQVRSGARSNILLVQQVIPLIASAWRRVVPTSTGFGIYLSVVSIVLFVTVVFIVVVVLIVMTVVLIVFFAIASETRKKKIP